MYITGRGTPPFRMIPLDEHEMWIEQLQAIVRFQRSGLRVSRAVFFVGDQQMAANRIDDAAGSASGSASGS
jgi:hypothetical protein